MKGYHKMKFSHRSSTAKCGTRGFSMLELMIVCCVMHDCGRDQVHGAATGPEGRPGEFRLSRMP